MRISIIFVKSVFIIHQYIKAAPWTTRAKLAVKDSILQINAINLKEGKFHN